MKYDESWCLPLLVTLEVLVSDLVVFNIFILLCIRNQRVKEPAPPAEEPSSGQRPGSSCP